MSYRARFYLEFCPMDYEQHVKSSGKSLQDLVSKRGISWAIEKFGPGELKIDRFEEIRLLDSGIPLWCLDGYWYFDSIDFTDAQKAYHKKYYGEHGIDAYEEIPETKETAL